MGLTMTADFLASAGWLQSRYRLSRFASLIIHTLLFVIAFKAHWLKSGGASCCELLFAANVCYLQLRVVTVTSYIAELPIIGTSQGLSIQYYHRSQLLKILAVCKLVQYGTLKFVDDPIVLEYYWASLIRFLSWTSLCELSRWRIEQICQG